MQPSRPPANGYLITAREAAIGAERVRIARPPLFIRHTATRPAVIGFLAFSIRNISFGCCALKQITCARFIVVVALLRFESPLRGQIAREGLFELMEV
jgi:hypothetical protein